MRAISIALLVICFVSRPAAGSPGAVSSRQLLGRKAATLPADFTCEDPQSLIEQINFPAREEPTRLGEGIKSAAKGAKKGAKATKKAAKATKKAAKVAKKTAKKAAKKATKASGKNGGKNTGRQEMCCEKSDTCFDFCHKDCPGYKVKGVGTVYAQYQRAGKSARNEAKVIFKKNPGMAGSKLFKAIDDWGSMRLCTAANAAERKDCLNDGKKPNKIQTALQFSDKKLTLATNGHCTLKWGFKRNTYKNQKLDASLLARLELGSEQNAGARRLLTDGSKKSAKKTAKAAKKNTKKSAKAAKKAVKKAAKKGTVLTAAAALAGVLTEYKFTVDELFATLCNVKTGKCAQQKAVINCIRSRYLGPQGPQTKECTLGEKLTYGQVL